MSSVKIPNVVSEWQYLFRPSPLWLRFFQLNFGEIWQYLTRSQQTNVWRYLTLQRFELPALQGTKIRILMVFLILILLLVILSFFYLTIIISRLWYFQLEYRLALYSQNINYSNSSWSHIDRRWDIAHVLNQPIVLQRFLYHASSLTCKIWFLEFLLVLFIFYFIF